MNRYIYFINKKDWEENLELRENIEHWKFKNLDLSPILYKEESSVYTTLFCSETAAATPAPWPVTVQAIMLRMAACDTMSPATQRPATSRLSTSIGTMHP